MSRRDRIERNRHADCGVSYGECARAIAAETSTVGTTGENTVGFSKEMVAALEADGEKLRQLTGDDHGPFWPVEHTESPIIAECDCCGAKRALTRCWLGDMETFACDECRGARD
jgi:hypothetical protein